MGYHFRQVFWCSFCTDFLFYSIRVSHRRDLLINFIFYVQISNHFSSRSQLNVQKQPFINEIESSCNQNAFLRIMSLWPDLVSEIPSRASPSKGCLFEEPCPLRDRFATSFPIQHLGQSLHGIAKVMRYLYVTTCGLL